MKEIVKEVSAWMASHSSTYVIAAAVLAFLVPDVFGWVRGDVSSVILGVIMLTMGLTLSTEDFRILFSRPWDIFIGACAQFTLMPLLAFTLTKVFGLNPYLSIGIILVGCCPGGVSSNIMSFLCKGDVAFSVGMTTASTLLAPVMTPLLVWWLADTRIEVDTLGMFRGILLITIITVGIGFLVNHYASSRKWYEDVRQIMPGVSGTCLALIVSEVVSQVKPQLMAQGTTQRIASGLRARISSLAKKAVASTVAIPAFCIPTSIDIVRFLGSEKWKSLPTLYPRRYPRVLWQNTTASMSRNSPIP